MEAGQFGRPGRRDDYARVGVLLKAIIGTNKPARATDLWPDYKPSTLALWAEKENHSRSISAVNVPAVLKLLVPESQNVPVPVHSAFVKSGIIVS